MDKIALLCQKQLKISQRGLSLQWQNTDACQSFYNGDMMTYSDRIQFATQDGQRKRTTVAFNKVQSNVDSVVGFMAQNRREPKFLARLQASPEQQRYSKNMNALYGYHRENENADQIETEQDSDMLVNGYGATDVDLSYIQGNASTSPYGDIIKVRLEPRQVGWDPRAKQKNLLDARWAYYYDDYELKEALSLFQGSNESDFEKVSNEEPADTGYVYNPWGGLYDKIKLVDTVEWAAREQDMVRVYNHQWMEYETFYRAKNPIYSAQTPEDASFFKIQLDIIQSEIPNMGPEDLDAPDMFAFDPLSEELVFDEKTKTKLKQAFGELIEPVSFKRKVFHTAVYSGSHVFTHFRSISQQGFSIKFKTGTYNAQDKIWVGMVNSMMEPQKYYNKALTELLFTIASNSKGGVMVEENAVESISDFESKWAKTDAVIKVNDGALSGQKIQEKTRGALPTGLEGIIQLCDANISANGVDPSFLGQIGEQESGILYKRRIRQVISKMGRYFDSLTMYQKEDARLHADLIPVWVENNNGQWVRITGEDGADEFVQVSSDMLTAEYDISIQEASQTPEDKQETALVLNALGDKLAMINPPAAQKIWAESLSMMSMDVDVVGRIREVLQPNEEMVPIQEVQKLQQMIEQLQSQLNMAQVTKLQSETEKNQATTQKIAAEIPKTQAQTVSELETARRTGYENDILQSGNYEPANVSI